MLSLMFVVFIILLIIGVPLGFSLVLASVVYIMGGGGIPLPSIPQRMISGIDSFSFMAIPFFFLAGEIMNHGGLTTRIVKFCNGLVGWVRGGLAYATVVVNMILAGISGSALADAAATGSILIPAMEKAGYEKRFAAALSASAGTIGPVIPPSIPFVLYASISSVSVGKLFLAGAVPGIVMGVFMMIVIYWIARKRNYPREKRQTGREMLNGFKDALLALLMPLIILGTILFGITTPTEGAVIAVVYALIVSMVVYKEINLKSLIDITYNIAISSAVIMFIVSAANQFGWILSREQVPIKLQMAAGAFTSNPMILLLLINLLLIFMGCFMEGNSIIIILTPVLLPMLQKYGINLLHFGVLFTLNMMVGLLTPPVGMNLFVVSKVSGVSLSEIVRELLPFLLGLVVLLIIVTYVPQFSLWLPSLFVK
ncbi:MAG: TRAP transporter large permease [Bacillota bacterium]